MKYLVDYHVHSDNSFDCPITMVRQCEQAIEIGIQEIVFTEHFDSNPYDESTGFFNYQKYKREIEECRDKFGDQIVIKKGLELGEPHLYKQQQMEFIRDKDFDFLLGSVHFIEDLPLSADFGWKQRDLYLKYFTEVLETALHGEYHTLGHLDVLKRYVPEDFEKFFALDYQEIIREILKVVIQRGKGIEINTSGYRQGFGEPLPTVDILKWYYQLGGKIITIGSDAHHFRHLGQGLNQGYNLLKEIGFQAISIFNQGKVDFIKL